MNWLLIIILYAIAAVLGIVCMILYSTPMYHDRSMKEVDEFEKLCWKAEYELLREEKEIYTDADVDERIYERIYETVLPKKEAKKAKYNI